MNRVVRFIPSLFVLLFLLYVNNSAAKNIDAASCSRQDVQSAIDAASDGDVVIIPPGSCTWNTAVTFSNKAITVQGAGIDQTIITDLTGSKQGEAAFWIEGV